jgi:hypothetical protein
MAVPGIGNAQHMRPPPWGCRRASHDINAKRAGVVSPRYTAPLAVFTVLRSSAEIEFGGDAGIGGLTFQGA